MSVQKANLKGNQDAELYSLGIAFDGSFPFKISHAVLIENHLGYFGRGGFFWLLGFFGGFGGSSSGGPPTR